MAFLAEGLAWHGDRATALAALREGLETADATGEHFWDAELHRVTGTVLLAENKLWGEQARRAEARDLLAPIYGWFTEGFDTPDLKEAKALLEELG